MVRIRFENWKRLRLTMHLSVPPCTLNSSYIHRLQPSLATLETLPSKRRYAASTTSLEQGHGHKDSVVVLATMPISCWMCDP